MTTPQLSDAEFERYRTLTLKMIGRNGNDADGGIMAAATEPSIRDFAGLFRNVPICFASVPNPIRTPNL